MTSTPDSVRPGDPVTFNITLTNHSACPLKQPLAEVVAFVSKDEVDRELALEGGPNPPPEVVEFLDRVRAFLDDLCSGGNPEPPEPPPLSRSCTRGNDEVACDFTGPAPAHEGSTGSFTFATLGNLLRCEVDAGTMRCHLRLPLPSASANTNAALGGAAAATQALTCLTQSDLPLIVSEVDAVCFVGTLAMMQGLAPGEMGTGQFTLPARGGGFMRNFVFAFNNSDSSDIGVCKSGANGGQACSSSDDCPGSSCGDGICDGGSRNGKGCDVSTGMTDCPYGGTCVACEPGDPDGFLPVDCTTTYVSPEPVPVVSPWGLAGVAIALFAIGAAWLRRRTRRIA